MKKMLNKRLFNVVGNRSTYTNFYFIFMEDCNCIVCTQKNAEPYKYGPLKLAWTFVVQKETISLL